MLSYIDLLIAINIMELKILRHFTYLYLSQTVYLRNSGLDLLFLLSQSNKKYRF